MESDSEDMKAYKSFSWQCDSSTSSSSESLASLDKLKETHTDRRSSNTIVAEHRQGKHSYHPNSSLRQLSQTHSAHRMIKNLFRRSFPAPPTPVGERVLQALKDQPSFWEAHAYGGTDYKINEAELRRITDVDNRRTGASDLWYVTTVGHFGFRKALEHLAELQAQPRTIAQEAARMRLNGAWDHPARETNPDLYIKIVHDLDLLLFSGELEGRLLVTWEDKITPFLHPGVPPEKQPHPYFRHHDERWRDPLRGWCNPAAFRLFGLQKAHICLNKDLYLKCEKRVMWGLIIYEMIMAYVNLGCGHFANDELLRGAEVNRVRKKCLELLEFVDLELEDVQNGWVGGTSEERRMRVSSSPDTMWHGRDGR